VVWPKHLKAAKSSTDAGGYNRDSEADVGLIPIPTVSKDPLHFIFDYVAGRMPECNMVLVHDEDLTRISGICDIDM